MSEESQQVSRKAFIFNVIAGLSLLIVPTSRFIVRAEKAQNIAELLGNSAEARRIGLRCRCLLGSENTEGEIRRALFDDLSETQRKGLLSSRTKFREFISRKSKDDYSAGRVCRADGLYLSVTEIRVCVLAAIT